MNIIKTVKTRIEEYLLTNKNPCKNYKTEEAAEKATSEAATLVAQHFSSNNETLEQADYVVFYVESWGRWVGAIDLTKVTMNPKAKGGYLGIVSQLGFYSY
jgi:hypothetical protein